MKCEEVPGSKLTVFLEDFRKSFVGLEGTASRFFFFHSSVPTAYQLHPGRLLIKANDSFSDKNIFVTSGNTAIQTTKQAVRWHKLLGSNHSISGAFRQHQKQN